LLGEDVAWEMRPIVEDDGTGRLVLTTPGGEIVPHTLHLDSRDAHAIAFRFS